MYQLTRCRGSQEEVQVSVHLHFNVSGDWVGEETLPEIMCLFRQTSEELLGMPLLELRWVATIKRTSSVTIHIIKYTKAIMASYFLMQDLIW